MKNGYGMGQIIPLNHLYKPSKIIIAIYPTVVGDIQDSAGRYPIRSAPSWDPQLQSLQEQSMPGAAN